jgi:hypothetical protein
MPLSDRDNYLRTASMTGGEWIPMRLVISGAEWDMWREELEEVVVRHPTFFPGFERGRRDYDNWDFGRAYRAGEDFTDNWGCVWHSEIDGIEGIVHGHPLADWAAFDDFRPPDPATQLARGEIDWEQTRRSLHERRDRGLLTTGGVEHGFLFMRLYYLRGFENLMLDMAADEPRLHDLIRTVTDFNLGLVSRYLDIGVDVMHLGEDLGAQRASVMGPAQFTKWIAPAYRRLMDPCRQAGLHVHLHSDGYILDIADEILDCGVTIINPQDLLHGIDNLAAELKGRVCVDLDVDRQSIVPFGTRQEIHDLIEEEVRKLGSPQGGLMMVCGIYPPTPPENVDALCSAFEQFRTYWW